MSFKENKTAILAVFAFLVAGVSVVSQLRYQKQLKELTAEHAKLQKNFADQTTEFAGVQEDQAHIIDMIKAKVDIIDETIDADKKRQSRVNNVVAAIKVTLPKSRRPENCEVLPTPGEILRVAGAVVDMSERYAVPQALILGVIRQESGFCNEAKSGAGAQGYMQLMPDTAAMVMTDIGAPLSVWKTRDNVHLGTAYLHRMLNEFRGDVDLAVKAYNGGPTHVKRVRAGEVENYHKETREYSEAVLGFKQEYEKLGVL